MFRRRGLWLCVALTAASLGSGPAAMLAQAAPPPDKLVFIVPFDRLKSVGAEHAPSFLANLVLAGTWDNIEALSGYRGPVDVFGEEKDEVIPVAHARALAESLPQAKFHLVPGGHGWALTPGVEVRFP